MKPQKVTSIFLFKSILILLSIIIISYSLGELVEAQSDVSAIVEEVAPAVVKIETEEGGGSGFIIHTDGYIITNYHVVQKAISIRVIRHEGEEYEATLVDYSERSDLALLKIRAKNLPEIELGDSNRLKIGDSILAMGYPLGTFSVTTGILSSVLGEGKVLQITAPINPGNSGGPLVNKDGKVVGVVFSKADAKVFLEKYGFIPEGVAFAVPIDIVKGLFKLTKEGLPRIPKPRFPTPKRLIYESSLHSWPDYSREEYMAEFIPPWLKGSYDYECKTSNLYPLILGKATFKDFILEVDVAEISRYSYTVWPAEPGPGHEEAVTKFPSYEILFGVTEPPEAGETEFVYVYPREYYPDKGFALWIDSKNHNYSLFEFSGLGWLIGAKYGNYSTNYYWHVAPPIEYPKESREILLPSDQGLNWVTDIDFNALDIQQIIGPTSSSHIQPGWVPSLLFKEGPQIKYNHIKIATLGSSIAIYINGHLLAKKDSISLSRGYIGFISIGGKVVVKNVKVYSTK